MGACLYARAKRTALLCSLREILGEIFASLVTQEDTLPCCSKFLTFNKKLGTLQ